MKRLIIVTCIVALLLAIPFSNSLQAKGGNDKAPKVKICHVIAVNDVIPFGPGLLYFGIEIEIAASAVDAHIAHGDSTIYFVSETVIQAFRDAGANLPNADCYLFVPPPGDGNDAEEPPKVKICHVIAANDAIEWGAGMLYFGIEIEIAASAVDAHIAHGDSDNYFAPDVAAGPIETFRAAGVNIPNADCYLWVAND